MGSMVRRNGDAMTVSRETNPFDAATAALIECFEANEAYYQTGQCLPNYPMPAIRYRTVSSLINLGYVSALNKFDIDVVFEHYIKE